MDTRIADSSAEPSSEAITQVLRDALSDIGRRENVVARARERQDRLLELGMLDVDLIRSLADGSDTQDIEKQIAHHEQQLGMK